MKFFKLLALSALLVAALGRPSTAQVQGGGQPPHPPFTLTSTAFNDGDVIPNRFTGAVAAPVSPALSWSNPPTGTASFALILHDPDTAPAKGIADVLHWIIFNIPATANSLPEGVPGQAQLSDGTIQGHNLRNTTGFMGPGAPPGNYHHYTFELYALDTTLSLGPDASRAAVLAAMDGHILGKAVLIGRFHR
jgi:Raf kinase inhibitor-like YbhB/YbcL family protein